MYRQRNRFLFTLLCTLLLCSIGQATILQITVQDSIDNSTILRATVFLNGENYGRTNNNGQVFVNHSGLVTGIPIKTFNVHGNRELILIPPKLEIVVRGAIDQLAVLTPDACGASVDFAAIQEDILRVLTPAVELPGGLTLISMRPDHVQFIIRRRL